MNAQLARQKAQSAKKEQKKRRAKQDADYEKRRKAIRRKGSQHAPHRLKKIYEQIDKKADEGGTYIDCSIGNCYGRDARGEQIWRHDASAGSIEREYWDALTRRVFKTLKKDGYQVKVSPHYGFIVTGSSNTSRSCEYVFRAKLLIQWGDDEVPSYIGQGWVDKIPPLNEHYEKNQKNR